MSGSAKPLSPEQQRAAWLVALGEMTRPEIAAQCGVSERALYNWLAKETFQAEVQAHCRQLMKELIAPALYRLKENIRRGKPAEANKAIELALRAAGWLSEGKANDGRGPGASPGDDDASDLEGLGAAELTRRYREALE